MRFQTFQHPTTFLKRLFTAATLLVALRVSATEPLKTLVCVTGGGFKQTEINFQIKKTVKNCAEGEETFWLKKEAGGLLLFIPEGAESKPAELPANSKASLRKNKVNNY